MDLQSQLQRTLGDGYTLERELAAGGMARVFVARDVALGRRVVVKTLADDSGVSVSAERFRREIRLAASLQQANIVPVHSAGDVDGVPYYTMPFVEGESLRAHLDSRGALDVREAVNILRDVARALAFAHERGVVHRDIKPENILLSGNTAVVTDFGIAKAIEASHSMGGQTTLTQLGTLLGTPAYISPEQAAGDPNVDHLADIYSLGVVAYEMLAGTRPFTATAARALLAAHVNEAPQPLAERCAGVPPRLAALVMRCLEKEPARRPQRAADLLEALDVALESGTVASFATAAGKAAIVVLPFANLSPDPADEYFADGLTDEIITDLSPIAALRVVARAASMRYKGTAKDPQTVAHELGVRYVLDGSVRRAGSSLRLTARLIDASNGSTLWSEKLGGSVEDAFAMQERVSRTIVDALKVTLSPQEAQRMADRVSAPAPNAEAVEAYLKGRHFFRQATGDGMLKAIESFQRATDIDPDFAPALAALAYTYVWITTAWAALPARETMPKASAAARHALELNPNLPEAHASLALVATFYDWDPLSAGRAFGEALRLNPNYAEAHGWYTAPLIWLDTRFDEAIQHARRAVELNPVDPWLRYQLCWSHYFARDFERSLEENRKLIDLEPLWGLGHYYLGASLATCGRAAEALASIMRGIELDGRGVHHIAWLGACHAAGGNETEALRCLAELEEHERAGKAVWAWKLVIYANLGETEHVMKCLEQAFIERSASLVFHLTHPLVDPVRTDQRFVDLMRRMHLEHLTTYRPQSLWQPSFGPANVAAQSRAVASGKRSVAILPFANLSPDPENEFFADGITDDLIAQVAKIGSLRVIARTSVMRYRGVQDAARTAARELGVTAVIEGTVRRAGKRARIVAQLIDSVADAPIWSETYDRDLDDIFSVQTEVATSVAGALKATLTPDEQAVIQQKPTADAAAYDLYLLGRHHWNKRTDESIKKAIDCFQQAIGRDTRYAAAHAGLADAYVFAGIGYAAIPPAEAFAKAKAAATSAVTLDHASADAHCSAGLTAMWCDWDIPRATAAFERSVSLRPNHSPGHQWLGWCRFSGGDYIGALKSLERALELDPLNASLTAESGWPFTYAALHDHGMQRYRRALEIDPAFGLGHYNVGLSHSGSGRYHEALVEYEIALKQIGRTPWVLADMAAALVALGQRANAEALLDELVDQAKAGSGSWLSVAIAADALGMTDQALEMLDLAYAAHAPMLFAIGMTEYIPLRNARKDPRFGAFMMKLGIKPHDIPRQRELLLAHAKR